ncbi:MAG TPA: hypothetical protein VIO32_05595, partial [Candidatus Baltobacteraceae bacterium]
MSHHPRASSIYLLVVAGLLAACSSGHLPDTSGLNGSGRAPLSTTGTITVSGVIESTSSSQQWILMKTSQCGYEYVDYTSSTTITYNGQTMSPGTTATATGTGSCSTRIAAQSITLQSKQTITIGGVIYSTGSNSFVLKGTVCGYEPVSYTSSTTINYNGQKLAPGTYATVQGTGSCSTTINAQTIKLSASAPTPTPS